MVHLEMLLASSPISHPKTDRPRFADCTRLLNCRLDHTSVFPLSRRMSAVKWPIDTLSVAGQPKGAQSAAGQPTAYLVLQKPDLQLFIRIILFQKKNSLHGDHHRSMIRQTLLTRSYSVYLQNQSGRLMYELRPYVDKKERKLTKASQISRVNCDNWKKRKGRSR